MGNKQSTPKNAQQFINALQNITKENPNVPAQCNWRNTNRCIFKDYSLSDGSCSVSGNNNPAYNASGLSGYNEQQFSNWLSEIYNRNTGNDATRGEAANVYQYWTTCQNAPGYEFLKKLNFEDPGRKDKLMLENSKKLLDDYVSERKINFNNLQELQMVRDDLFKKVQLLQSRQDLYIESARLDEVENKKKLALLDAEIAVMRRKIMYDFEEDMIHNSKIYFLGNITFYLILFIIGIILYYRFLSE
jgi:hypothetical protein